MKSKGFLAQRLREIVRCVSGHAAGLTAAGFIQDRVSRRALAGSLGTPTPRFHITTQLGGFVNMKLERLKFSIGVAAALATSGANAVTWQAGDWTLGISGQINSYFIHTNCSNGDLKATRTNNLTATGSSCLNATDQNGNFEDQNAVTNGLLPSSLGITTSTTQNGWDLGTNVTVYYASRSEP